MTKIEIQNIINPRTNRLQLSKLTISLEKAYCIYNSIETPPLCKCGKSLPFINFKSGYRKSCGNSKCKNKKLTMEPKILTDKVINEIFKGKGFNYKLAQKYGITQKDCYDYKFPGKEMCSCSTKKKFINFKIGYRQVCNCKKSVTLTKEFIIENNGVINNKLNPSFMRKYDVTVNEVYSVYNNISIPKCQCGEECKVSIFSKGPSYYCGRKECKNSILTRDWILFPENINRDFWIKNFSQDGFIDVSKVHEYHNLSYTGIYLRIKEFNLKIKKVNKAEALLLNLVHGAELNTRKIITPFELDLYSKEYKFAIEYNGLMWHSHGISKHSMFNNTLEEPNKHLIKTTLCEEKDIQLFHIFENEWLNINKKHIWISMIRDKQNLNTKIGARKCIIKEVPTKEARRFIEDNHMQGYCNSSIKIGLYYNYNLVSIMTFGKPRFNKNIEYELIRFCTKKNITVQGGGSRLLKAFEKMYKPKSLLSYANRRWSTGNFYRKVGFNFIEDTKPNYFYFLPKEGILYNRTKFQKHKLKSLLSSYIEEETEKENMYNNGYRKIFDSGNKTFIKEYK